MAQTIKLKRSAVAGRIPSTSDLALGEVAINTYDGKIYIKKSVNGTESVVEVGGGGLSGSAFTQYTFTATASQTDFTGADNASNILDVVDEFSNVFMNGVLLDPDVDYNISADGLTLTLTTAAATGDIIQINSFDQATFNGTLLVDALQFDGAPGTLTWNSDEECVDIPLNSDVTLQVGQEFVFRAKATEAIANGDAVMFAGAQGSHLLIAKADMNSVGFAPEYVVGIATQDFALNDFGFVTQFGKVRGLDTSAYNEGDILYLDPTTAGALTTTRPTPPNHIIQLCAVVYDHATQGTLLVRPTHFPDTDEVPEGSSNLYFTDARAVTAIQGDASWNATQWDTAYGWGDHSTEGYLTSYTETDPIYTASSWYTTTNNSANWDTAYGWGDHSTVGYLTSYTETDPIYTASSWYTTTNNSANWNTAYGWGDHSTAGYLTSETNTSLSLASNILTYTDENGTATNIDLSLYLDDTNLARLTSGTIDGNGLATFTRDDATTFTVDFSSLFDDTNLARITSASFGTSTGDLTLTRDDATTVVANLDGRYLTSYTETDPIYTASSWYTTTNNSANWDTAYGWGDHSTAGYLTSYTETDPIYTTSSWYTTTNNSSNWDTAYGWGDHSTQNYAVTTGDTFTGTVNINGGELNIGTEGRKVTFQTSSSVVNELYSGDTFNTNGFELHTPNGITFAINENDNTAGSFTVLGGSSYAQLLDVNLSGDLTILGGLSASGYNNSNWDTAYGWGDHSTQGYLTSTWSSDITWQNTVNINTYGETSFDMREAGSQWGVWTFNDSEFSIKVPYSGQVVIGEAGSRGLSVVGALGVSGAITASGYNSANWDTAYTYSQVGHLPLAGGELTGRLKIQSGDIATRKIVLWDGASDNDFQFYGFGIESNTLVQSINASSDFFRWFRGDSTTARTQLMELEGTAGTLSVAGGLKASQNSKIGETTADWGSSTIISPLDTLLELGVPNAAATAYPSASGIVFHHGGVSTSRISYHNTALNASYFDFESDDTSFNGIYIKGNQVISGSREVSASRYSNGIFYGSSASNSRNHFVQYNAGNASVASGWIAAAFGDNLADRVVIGQGADYGSGAILAAHNSELTDWADLSLVVKNNLKLYSASTTGTPVFNVTSTGITSNSISLLSDSNTYGTANGNSHYQWEGATYRNPTQWTTRQIIRVHNDSTGDNGHYPNLVLYNESGLLNSTVGMSFASREADGAGNAVPLAGLQATKTIAGNASAWSSGSLTAYVKDLGTRRNIWTGNTDGSLTVHGVLKSDSTDGLKIGGFTTANADEWPNVTWLRDVPNGWDEGLMKASSSRGVFGREHFAIHFDQDRSFAFHSSSWDTEMEISGDGRIYMKGPVGIGVVPSDLFEVQKDSTSAQVATFRNSSGPFVSRIYGDYANDGTIVEYQERVGADANKASVGTFSAHQLDLRTNNTTRMYLGNSGNVYIPDNRLIVQGVGTANSAPLTLSITSSNSYNHAQETFAPNLTAGEAVINVIGRDGSGYNAGYLGWVYSGTAASTDNYLTLGHWNNDHLVRLYGDGNLQVGNTSNVATKLGVYQSGAAPTATFNSAGQSNFGASVLVGNTVIDQTLQDTLDRPMVVIDGQYPVLNMNHSVTSNDNHGPTIQFTFDGYNTSGSNGGRQIVIGTDGQGQRLDFGFAGDIYGSNADLNPHRGIAGYAGPTPMRLFHNGLVVGATGTYPNEIASTNYALNVQGDEAVTGNVYRTTYNKSILLYSNGTSSSGSAIGLQQVTAEGWSGIFVDYNPYEGWGLYHDNPSNFFYITAETSTGSLGTSFTVPNRDSGSSTAYAKIRFNQNNGNIDSGGTITALGDITAYASDGRLKTNYQNIDGAIDKVKSLRGLYFDWKEDLIEEVGFKPSYVKKDVGLIAQDVQAIMPQAVDLAPFDTVYESTPTGDKNSPHIETVKSKTGNDYLTVKYDKLVPLLVEAIKEQQNEIDELKTLVKQLMEKL